MKESDGLINTYQVVESAVSGYALDVVDDAIEPVSTPEKDSDSKKKGAIGLNKAGRVGGKVRFGELKELSHQGKKDYQYCRCVAWTGGRAISGWSLLIRCRKRTRSPSAYASQRKNP